jgi:AraC-like DNA-binding protein
MNAKEDWHGSYPCTGKFLRMVLKVKNMICQRCIIVINELLAEFKFEATEVVLGKIVLTHELSAHELDRFNTALKKTGLELVFSNDELIVQKIKHVIYEIVHCADEPLLENFSTYLSRQLNYSYAYLANTFRRINEMPIERFLIAERIRKVQMMLISEELTLSEIAYKLNYSSVAHLSAQFKKVTGVRASDYRYMNIRTNEEDACNM